MANVVCDKGIIIVGEGQCERIFYKRLFNDRVYSRGDCKIDYTDMAGIGNFYSRIRGIKARINTMKKNVSEVRVLLCLDQDVFKPVGGQLQKINPPPKPEQLCRELRDSGAKISEILMPPHSIEDWIVLDTLSILNHLRLPQNTHINGTYGKDKLAYLYGQADKAYNKTRNDMEALIDCLDMDLVYNLLPNEARDVINNIFQGIHK